MHGGIHVDNGIKAESITGKETLKTAEYQGFRCFGVRHGKRHNHS